MIIDHLQHVNMNENYHIIQSIDLHEENYETKKDIYNGIKKKV